MIADLWLVLSGEHSPGSVETAVYELTDGTSQLLLKTRYDSASGTLVASLDFRADDGTAVHGTLTHSSGLADGIPVSPSQNLIAEYLAAAPGEFGAIDDFSDATGDGGAGGSRCHEAQRLAENTPEKSASHNLS